MTVELGRTNVGVLAGCPGLGGQAWVGPPLALPLCLPHVQDCEPVFRGQVQMKAEVYRQLELGHRMPT